jgi:hypothetical protein
MKQIKSHWSWLWMFTCWSDVEVMKKWNLPFNSALKLVCSHHWYGSSLDLFTNWGCIQLYCWDTASHKEPGCLCVGISKGRFPNISFFVAMPALKELEESEESKGRPLIYYRRHFLEVHYAAGHYAAAHYWLCLGAYGTGIQVNLC